MKLNWTVRFRNKTWLTMFVSLIIGFVFNMLKLFDIVPTVTENTVATIAAQILEFLGLIGVLIDPTTSGFGDSARAMSYVDPWVDEQEASSDLKSNGKCGE